MTTIETHQVVSFKRSAGEVVAWCPLCLREVEMVSLYQAALVAGVTLRDICQRVSDDNIHLVESASEALICVNSLRKFAEILREELES